MPSRRAEMVGVEQRRQLWPPVARRIPHQRWDKEVEVGGGRSFTNIGLDYFGPGGDSSSAPALQLGTFLLLRRRRGSGPKGETIHTHIH